MKFINLKTDNAKKALALGAALVLAAAVFAEDMFNKIAESIRDKVGR